MRKFLALFMVTVTLVTLTACNTKKYPSGKPATDSVDANAQIEPVTDPPETIDFDITDLAKYIDDALGADLDKYDAEVDTNCQSLAYYSNGINTDFELDLTFDGINFTKGTSPKVLLDNGYVSEDEEMLIISGGSELVYFSQPKKDINILLNLSNDSTEDKAAKDCTVSGFMLIDSLDYADYYGLSGDSELSDVLETLGAPTSITANQLQYFYLNYDNYNEESELSTLTFMISFNGKDTHIKEISYI